MKNRLEVNIFFLMLFLCHSVSSALDFSGNMEDLVSLTNKKDTIVNPGNILSIPDYSNLAELRINLASKHKNILNIDARARYDSATQSGFSSVDQAYLALEPNEMLKLKIGRQKIGFGVGYLWNPVNDLDKIKDAYNPAKYTEGVDSMKISVDLTQNTGQPLNFNFAVIPPDSGRNLDISYSKIGSQVYTLYRDIEIGLTASYCKNLSSEDSVLYGAYSSIDLEGTILGMEYSRSRKNNRLSFTDTGSYTKSEYCTQVVLNANRRITEKSFLVLEYFYNGNGYAETEFNNIVELVRSSYSVYGHAVINALNPGYVNRNYLFGTVSLELSGYLSLALSSMYNTDRQGGFVYPALSWTKLENVTLSLEGIANLYSDMESEFSLTPYNNMLLLRGQYFF